MPGKLSEAGRAAAAAVPAAATPTAGSEEAAQAQQLLDAALAAPRETEEGMLQSFRFLSATSTLLAPGGEDRAHEQAQAQAQAQQARGQDDDGIPEETAGWADPAVLPVGTASGSGGLRVSVDNWTAAGDGLDEDDEQLDDIEPGLRRTVVQEAPSRSRHEAQEESGREDDIEVVDIDASGAAAAASEAARVVETQQQAEPSQTEHLNKRLLVSFLSHMQSNPLFAYQGGDSEDEEEEEEEEDEDWRANPDETEEDKLARDALLDMFLSDLKGEDRQDEEDEGEEDGEKKREDTEGPGAQDAAGTLDAPREAVPLTLTDHLNKNLLESFRSHLSGNPALATGQDGASDSGEDDEWADDGSDSDVASDAKPDSGMAAAKSVGEPGEAKTLPGSADDHSSHAAAQAPILCSTTLEMTRLTASVASADGDGTASAVQAETNEVEAFALDPSFDYENVTLSDRLADIKPETAA